MLSGLACIAPTSVLCAGPPQDRRRRREIRHPRSALRCIVDAACPCSTRWRISCRPRKARSALPSRCILQGLATNTGDAAALPSSRAELRRIRLPRSCRRLDRIDVRAQRVAGNACQPLRFEHLFRRKPTRLVQPPPDSRLRDRKRVSHVLLGPEFCPDLHQRLVRRQTSNLSFHIRPDIRARIIVNVQC